VDISTQALSLFFAMLMIGRLIGGFFVQRFGYVRSILFAGLGSMICLMVGTLTTLSVFLPLTGFFFSIIFPTITAAVSDEHTENGNTILGTLFTFAGLGGMIGPWVIGWASTNLGLQAGFLLNAVFTFLFFLSIAYLMKGNQHGKNT
jgi:fucose permease